MNYKKIIIESNVIYSVNGNLTMQNIEEVDNLCINIRNTLKNERVSFIWDLSKTDIIDSTGLSIIAITIAYSLRNGKILKICNANSNNEKLIKICKMNKNVKFYKSLDEALEIMIASYPSLELVMELD